MGDVCLYLGQMERASRLTQRAWKGHMARGSGLGVVFGKCQVRICECFPWTRLGHVPRSLPGAIWTAAHEVCLEEVSETSSTTCGIQTSSPGHNSLSKPGAEAAGCPQYPLYPYSTAVRFVTGLVTVHPETVFLSFPCS